MKKMIVKNWKRIAAVMMAVILVVGSVNLSELSASAEGENTEPNAVGGVSLNDFSLYQFLTYYQYVIKGDATIGNHTVGSMLIGGEGTIGAFGEGALGPVYIHNLQGSENYANRYPEISQYYTEQRVPAYYGAGSVSRPSDWNEWNSSEKFVDFEAVFNGIENESRNIANTHDVMIDYNGSDFSITGNKDAVTVDTDFIQGKWGNLLTIDFSKISSITISNAAFQKLVAIDIHVNNIDDFNKPHNISILGDSINVSYAYNPVMGTHPSIGDGAVCVTINGATFQGGALKSMTGNKQAGQLLDAPMELLWNFPDAETASVEYLGGHVVAPKATVTIHGGNFEGGVIAAGLINKSAEGHMYPYYGIPKNFNEKPPEKPEEEESLKITVPIYIEKTFGSSDFPDNNERRDVLQKTYFAVFHDNNGYVQTIRYNQGNDTSFSGTDNRASYAGEFTFSAEKNETYYFYLAELATDTNQYKICDYRWAIKVEVDDNGDFSTTYVQYKPTYEEGSSGKVDTTEQDKLSGYASKNDPLEFVNEKIEVEKPDPVSYSFTIGLNKIYEGLDLKNYAGDVQEFLNGTEFKLVEVNESGQPMANATAITLNPKWNGSDAVVSREITIPPSTTKYYQLSEIWPSGGFATSSDVYIWKIDCDGNGNITADYKKVGEAAYTRYIEGSSSYPIVTNNPVSFNGTISMIKTYDRANPDDPILWNGTTFALYNSIEDARNGQNAIKQGNSTDVHPEWNGKEAVVTFDLGDNFTVGLNDSRSFYIKETQAPTGYVKSNDIYVCKISNENGTYKVEYGVIAEGATTTNSYASTITCDNVKQSVQVAEVTVNIIKTFDDITGLSEAQMNQLVLDTKFTFYDEGKNATEDFKLQTTARSGGTVTYTYKYVGSALKPGSTYTYYVKETNTNTGIFTINDMTEHKIVITVGQVDASAVTQEITPDVKVDGNSTTNITFTNHRIPKAQASTEIQFTKNFTDGFDGLEDEVVRGIILATEFTLYNDRACGDKNVVAGFSLESTGIPDAGNVVYTYSLDTSSLNVDQTVTYYLKETNTDPRYYRQDGNVYEIKITVDSQGGTTVSYGSSGNLVIKNEPKDPDSTELNSPTISFSKEFAGFSGYTTGEANSIIAQTTFELVPTEGSATIGFVKLSSNPNDNGATYRYRLDLPAGYTGGTYYIKERDTDLDRYTISGEELTMQISVADGVATARITGDRTIIYNELIPPNDPPSTPPTPPTPNTPPGGGNNPPSPPPSGDNNPPSPPPPGGGNNPPPNPPSDEGNDPTKQSDTDSATTSLEFSDEASADRETSTLTNMTSAQTGEKKLPWAVFGGSISMIFIAGTVYVFRKKEKIEE